MDYKVISGSGARAYGLGVFGLLIYSSVLSVAQANHGNGPVSIAVVSAPGSSRAAEEFVREIDDPATGDRWFLERDSHHSGGPGRMVLVARGMASPLRTRASNEGASNRTETETPTAIIHAGDRLIVEEHSSLLDVVLEAIALAPACEGGTLRARLAIGGRVVNAVAVAPGRALLSPDSGERP